MTETTRRLISPCAEREENLVLLHYGDLGGTERDDLRVHVQSCAACAAFLEDLGALMPLTITASDPAPSFWSDYDRELRQKIDAAAERKNWLQRLADFFQPRWVPAFATAAIVALALTFTLGRGVWSPGEPAQEDAALAEVLPVAENLEFFSTMDVLDNLDLLESMGSQGNAA
jgi:hypothetical protein